jgi:hypothetical protein
MLQQSSKLPDSTNLCAAVYVHTNVHTLQNAPVVKFSGKELAPAFCSGTATCFTGTAGDTTGFTHSQPGQAKNLASRITGTR